MDVYRTHPAHLDAGHPCRHDEALPFSCSVGERKLMKHFVLWLSAEPRRSLIRYPRSSILDRRSLSRLLRLFERLFVRC